MYLFLAIVSGALLSVTILMNGNLSGSYGNYQATVFIHFIGLCTIIAILCIRKSRIEFRSKLPFYLYTGGAIGVLTVVFNNLTMAVIGISTTVALGLLGQTVSSLVIDQFGLFQVEVKKINAKKSIGLLFIMAGITIMLLY